MLTGSDELKAGILSFIKKRRVGVGEYLYSESAGQPTLYSSCYAAMTRSLLGDEIPPNERREWANYLHGFQDEDGLYRDPVIFGQGWYEGDSFDSGRPHLTCHVLTALACLGETARKPLAFIEEFLEVENLKKWLDAKDFGEKIAWTGNDICNLGTMLQYSRDFHNDTRAGKAAEYMLDWLDENHIDPRTGVWGSRDISEPIGRSHAVQAAYHWWLLYFYDRRPVPCIDRAIDTVLSTQNPKGGFGWGVHNRDEPFNGSACEDMDSIDPLVRMSSASDYRKEEVYSALKRASEWFLKNRTPDGGFVFILDRPFRYGHHELFSEAGKGGMFPTWFRTLSLSLIGDIIEDAYFIRCPGYQFPV